MRLGLPSGRTDVSYIIVLQGVNISVEDYTPVWKWITFSWWYPLIEKRSAGTTTTLADKDVFELSPSILSRPVFIKFSSLQLPTQLQKPRVANSLDIMGTHLDAIDTENATPRDRGTAYVYAVLMLLCPVRPAAPLARPERVELIAAVHDKALQRKDFSGLNQTGVSTIVSGAYNTYGAPIEIVVGWAFLYELLGWSAFAGFVVLNSYVVRRRVRMHKGELKARDGRMSMMNEFIGSALAPILLSTILFLTYVMLGNELTIGTAFTSTALFGMIRSPLNVIPSWVEEVSAQVSSLKKYNLIPLLDGGDDGVLGLENASLRWNQLQEEQEKAGEAREHSPTASIDGSTARG
ncbi:hypothetical protein B0H14DRAFT_3885841 [Mycena olivaceomarginata]|nr:hypothetical protein B0H14DRAFT_3885841 [Mycena olivaceomarginata]